METYVLSSNLFLVLAVKMMMRFHLGGNLRKITKVKNKVKYHILTIVTNSTI